MESWKEELVPPDRHQAFTQEIEQRGEEDLLPTSSSSVRRRVNTVTSAISALPSIYVPSNVATLELFAENEVDVEHHFHEDSSKHNLILLRAGSQRRGRENDAMAPKVARGGGDADIGASSPPAPKTRIRGRVALLLQVRESRNSSPSCRFTLTKLDIRRSRCFIKKFLHWRLTKIE